MLRTPYHRHRRTGSPPSTSAPHSSYCIVVLRHIGPVIIVMIYVHPLDLFESVFSVGTHYSVLPPVTVYIKSDIPVEHRYYLQAGPLLRPPVITCDTCVHFPYYTLPVYGRCLYVYVRCCNIDYCRYWAL